MVFAAREEKPEPHTNGLGSVHCFCCYWACKSSGVGSIWFISFLVLHHLMITSTELPRLHSLVHLKCLIKLISGLWLPSFLLWLDIVLRSISRESHSMCYFHSLSNLYYVWMIEHEEMLRGVASNIDLEIFVLVTCLDYSQVHLQFHVCFLASS
jgi:hypothetical protein